MGRNEINDLDSYFEGKKARRNLMDKLDSERRRSRIRGEETKETRLKSRNQISSKYMMMMVVFFFVMLFIGLGNGKGTQKKGVAGLNKAAFGHRHHDSELYDETHGPLIAKDKRIEIFEPFASSKELLPALDNVAHYVGLDKIESITLPVKLNLLFVGFDGDGRNAFEIKDSDLKPWFRHIDHDLRHLIVPVGEHQVTTEKFETPQTHIKHRVLIQVVKLHPLVNAIIENALLWGARPETFQQHHRSSDPGPHHKNEAEEAEDEEAEFEEMNQDAREHYIDAFKFSTILHHLLEYLGMNDTYSFFLLNPKPPFEGQNSVYGYRAGFSDAEIDAIFGMENLEIRDGSKDFIGRRFKKQTKATSTPTTSSAQDVLFSAAHRKLSQVDKYRESEEWANWYIKEYSPANEDGSEFWEGKEDEDDPATLMKRQHMQEPLEELVRHMGDFGTFQEMKSLRKIRNAEVKHGDCLVDLWVSHRRFAFLDISAGPFEWGPVIAAEGVRTFSTLPKTPGSTEPSARKVFSTEEERDIAVDWIDDQIMAIQDAYDRHCTAGDSRSAYCKGLNDKMVELEGTLEDLAFDQVKREDIAGLSEEHTAEPDMERDNFLSKLGGLLSSAFRHLVAPPTPLFKTPYTDRVSFHFFVVTSHSEYDPIDPIIFNYDDFKHEINKFKLPKQEFIWKMSKISFSDDPALATAFQTSLSTVVMPHLSLHGDYHVEEQLSLDSLELQRKLNHLEEHYEDKESTARFSRHIPIFLFSVGEGYSILIDRYSLSKALSNMVIIVQSPHPNWESRLFCNGKPIFWDLHNPIRSALASTALLLVGLVPSHISYNEAHKAATQEWIWSVGDSPLSHTSQGEHFSDFHLDIGHRNYIIEGLDETVLMLNNAVETLAKQKISRTIAELLPELDIPKLQELYNETNQLFLETAIATEHLDFVLALNKLKKAEATARLFAQTTKEFGDKLDSIRCTQLPSEQAVAITGGDTLIDRLLPAFFLLDALVLIAIMILKKKKSKAKVN